MDQIAPLARIADSAGPDPADAEATARPLSGALVALREESGDVPRDAALGTFRRQLARVREEVREAFESHALDGLAAARRLAMLTDGLIVALLDHAVTEIGGGALPEALAVAATGGYGRGVLAPFSDIDLLFLTRDPPSAPTRRVIEYMLYFLWDLGLKVGHASRSFPDCLAAARQDVTVRTCLLDLRAVAGDAGLVAHFGEEFAALREALGASGFIDAKQAEREARHRRYGDSPYLVEPNVKEGRGGLRDIQTLYWMSRYVCSSGEAQAAVLTDQEARHLMRSWTFLWTVRFHLHYVAGRADERLAFDMQPVIGGRMGYTRHGTQNGVERFMRHYFLTVREVVRLTHVAEPALARIARGPPALAAETDAALLDAGFVLAEGQVMSLAARPFGTEPVQMLRLLQVARDRGLRIHPLALRALIREERRLLGLRGDPTAAAIFLDLLCGPDMARADGARWLSVMNETGMLGRFLPDWARVVGQMQFDSYHIYTVDEHTIAAVRVLNAIERGELAEVAPVASSLVAHLQSRRALYVAMLLHDVAKGRGGDHSVLGAEIALEVGPTLGLTAEETDTASWLVLHHLLLSQTAFKRDIDDPKTILDVAESVQSPERLRLLLIMTVADMRAVSAKVWNGWKATLLRELYARVAEVLAGGLSTTERDVRVSRARQAVALLLRDWPEEAIEHFAALGYPAYWLSFDPETHARHARLVRDAERRGAPLVIDTQPLPARAVTEVTVYVADHPGLFSRVAGALAVAGASIVDARIHTLTNGMALDTFWIQDAAGGAFDQPHRLAKLSAVAEQAISGRLRLPAEIARLSGRLDAGRMRTIHVPPRVVVDNSASNTHTVLELNGRDRPGLLHDVTAAMREQGLQISSAHITTYGVRAVDVFYVRDVFGLKIDNERKLAQVRGALLAALAPPDPQTVQAEARRAAG